MAAQPVVSADSRQQALDAWTQYCESLKVAGQQLLRQDFPIDELDLAEGLRYLSRLVFTSIERNVEGADPANPLLYPLCNERIKIGGDNPDNRYFAAAVSAQHSYVLRGDFRRCSYYSVVATGRVDGSENVVSGSLNNSTVVVGADGWTEILISREPQGANHVAVDDRTTLLIIRCTIETGTDRQLPITLRRTDGSASSAAPQVPALAAALQNSANFVRNASSFFGDWTAEFQQHKNLLPLYRDQNYLVSIGGDPNIQYYLSAWELTPEQCLWIHVPSIPAATTWNCQLCNVWLESLDYTAAQIHLNSQTARGDADGGVSLFVCGSDPGHPNWLRTLGHAHGTICMRLVGAAEPLVANARVISLDAARQLGSKSVGHGQEQSYG